MTTIDRFESGFAVVETDDGFLQIPADAMPAGASEGDVIRQTETGWEIDREATECRRTRLLERRRRLLNGGQ